MDSILNSGEYEGRRVGSLVNKPGVIFSLIKNENKMFTDDVLAAARITRRISNVKIIST